MRTIPELFENSVERFATNALIKEKIEGRYQDISYQSIREQVKALSFGLIQLGVQKGDRVALLAEGSSQWLICELAVLYTGAICVPLSTKINEASDLHFRLEHSGSKFIFVSSVEYDKVKTISPRLKQLRHIILMDGKVSRNEKDILISELTVAHNTEVKKLEEEFLERMHAIHEDDIANISYTSGTTADPKGIMLSHRNYTANVEQASNLFEVPEWYVTLLILSWDHSFAHTTGLYTMIKNGASIAVVDPGKSALERLRNIPKNMREIRPAYQLSVPALARSIKKNIESGVRSKGKFSEMMFRSALKTAHLYHGDGWNKKKLRRVYIKPLLLFYDKMVFSKIRKNFGGRLKFFIGGGALLDLELQNFFYAIGIPMYQGYGLTEAAPVISSNTPEQHKLGSSGRVAENLEIRIIDENGNHCQALEAGEIVVKGENVMKGYWKNEIATRETVRDGWLFTGDRGYLDQDGFLYVLGRYKSLLIGNDGEKFSPEGIEETLVDGSDFIDQCLLHNNQNPFTIGLIVPNSRALITILKSKGTEISSDEAIDEAISILKNEIDQYYSGGIHQGLFPERWLPTAVGILNQPFSEGNGMINSTLKMVRNKVEDHYRPLIEYLYTAEGKRIHNQKNRESMAFLLRNPEKIDSP